MTATATARRARTAAEVAELHPELAVGTSVVVYPDWSREMDERPHGYAGTVARHARNGYVTVRDGRNGTTCDIDPRDCVPA